MIAPKQSAATGQKRATPGALQKVHDRQRQPCYQQCSQSIREDRPEVRVEVEIRAKECSHQRRQPHIAPDAPGQRVDRDRCGDEQHILQRLGGGEVAPAHEGEDQRQQQRIARQANGIHQRPTRQDAIGAIDVLIGVMVRDERLRAVEMKQDG
jgi:hypothetical protein